MLGLKKFSLLVLKEFTGPFILTFFISLFVLLMQFLWKYIDDLVGKGLDWFTIFKLLMYTTTTLVPLALPLAILVSSIMTFGNLSERFEIVAVKASGISLQHFMRPLLLTAVLISVLAFYFSNYVLPWSNLKAGALLYDIRQQKPALSIREGVFYNGIDGYSIKIGSKDADGKTIHHVMIYDHTDNNGNKKVVVADNGKMEMSTDKNFLVVTLFSGTQYEEQNKRKISGDSHPLTRYAFQSQIYRFDLSSFTLNRTDEDLFKDNNQMMNLWQLQATLDTFQLQYAQGVKEYKKEIDRYFYFKRDSNVFHILGKQNLIAVNPFDSLEKEKKKQLFDYALNQSRALNSFIGGNVEELDSKLHSIYRYQIEWHRKITLSIACFLLFLIGAPLGSIIRKGGMGLPIVISIVFFLIYHIISITGEKFAKEGDVSALRGMWQSSAVLLPIGFFLVYKATRDSALFDADSYLNFFKRFKKKSA